MLWYTPPMPPSTWEDNVVRSYLLTYTHTYIHTHIHIYIHTYICTYIYIHTYTYVRRELVKGGSIVIFIANLLGSHGTTEKLKLVLHTVKYC